MAELEVFKQTLYVDTVRIHSITIRDADNRDMFTIRLLPVTGGVNMDVSIVPGTKSKLLAFRWGAMIFHLNLDHSDGNTVALMVQHERVPALRVIDDIVQEARRVTDSPSRYPDRPTA